MTAEPLDSDSRAVRVIWADTALAHPADRSPVLSSRHHARTILGYEATITAAVAAERAKADRMRKWVVEHHDFISGIADHACGLCIPGGGLVIEGFTCVPHDALRATPCAHEQRDTGAHPYCLGCGANLCRCADHRTCAIRATPEDKS